MVFGVVVVAVVAYVQCRSGSKEVSYKSLA
jgi:hypothetical protein